MFIKYIAIDKDWNRDDEELIQVEIAEDYPERIKAIKVIGEVMCDDGLVRHVIGVEYSPEQSNQVASINVYLEE